MRDPVGQGGVDGVLGYVSFGSIVIVSRTVFGQGTTETFHLIGRLPGAKNDFTDPSHGLGIACHNRESPHIVKDVFSGHGFTANATFRELDVLGDGLVQMVADHEHVQMLVHSVDSKGSGRVGGGGEHVRFPTELHDIGCVAASRAFRVIGVNGPPFKSVATGFHESGFVQGVGVDADLHVVNVCHAQTGVDGGGRRTPVFVELETESAGLDLFFKWARGAGVALAQEPEV